MWVGRAKDSRGLNCSTVLCTQILGSAILGGTKVVERSLNTVVYVWIKSNFDFLLKYLSSTGNVIISLPAKKIVMGDFNGRMRGFLDAVNLSSFSIS